MSTFEKNTLEIIEQQIARYPLILYMKGTPENPCCGFSARVVEILKACCVKFAHINVLEEKDIRRDLPKYSKWPTFPQLYCNGKLMGGCDIVELLYKTGKLQEKLAET